MGFPGSSHSKESACNAGDPGSTLSGEDSPGEGNGNPLQYSCLEWVGQRSPEELDRGVSAMDRGTWTFTVHRVAKSQM